MGLNLSGMKKYQDDLESRSGGNKYFQQKQIGEETDIRILPPVPALNGLYFIERTVYWINNKPYVSPATFGKPCPMERRIAEIKEDAQEDDELEALLNNKKKFKKSTDFMMPILHLDVTFDDNMEPEQVDVVNDAAQIMTCGPQLMKAINRIATSRNFQNGTEDGFTDREKGYGLILSKKGSGLDTEYNAQGWNTQYEMPKKYYKDIPDVVAETEAAIYPDDYLLGVLDNYFYGEPMPAKPKKESKGDNPVKKKRTRTSAAEESDPKPKKRTRTAPAEDKPVKKKRTSSKSESEDKTVKTGKKSSGGKRDLMKDLNNM